MPPRPVFRTAVRILVRPDGFIGFRAAPADAANMKALDAHLMTYLVLDLG